MSQELLQLPSKEEAFSGCLTGHPELDDAWDFTAERLESVAAALAAAIPQHEPPRIALFIAGSYGRFEAGPPSDADLIIVYEKAAKPPKRQQVVETAQGIFRDLGIPAPNPTGVFIKQYPLATLINRAGSHDEDVRAFSQRMLLMMEARCIYGQEFGRKVMDRLVDWYFQYHEASPQKEAALLMNDAIRYFRTIAVNYQFTFGEENGKWPIRNLKLRHSRVAMYMGLMLLALHASSREHAENKASYIRSEMQFPPLARIHRVCSSLGERKEGDHILGLYARFLAAIRDSSRDDLLQLEYKDRYQNSDYRALRTNSSDFMRVLSELVYNQYGRGTWSHESFEYLLL